MSTAANGTQNGGQGSGVALQDALQNVDVLDELPLPDEQVSSIGLARP